MTKKPQVRPTLDALAPEARPALESFGPERTPRRVSTPSQPARTRQAVRRLLDGAGHGGAWADDERRR